MPRAEGRTLAHAEEVLVFAPVGRDGTLAQRLLGEAGFSCSCYGDVTGLRERLQKESGALLLTEEALVPPVTAVLNEALAAQPAWSELPVLLFVDAERSQAEGLMANRALGDYAHTTILTRPVKTESLLTVVELALAARRRQYEVRGLLEQLRLSEARFQAALKGSPVTVFNQDLSGRYTWLANPTLPGEAEYVLGKRDRDLFERPQDAARVEALTERVKATGQGAREEMRVQAAGQRLVFDLTVEPLRDAGGDLVGVTCASYDITDLKRAALEREERALERALEARTAEVRTRIGQDLHDRVVQGLLAVKLVATNLHRSFLKRGLPEAPQLKELADVAGEVNAELRRSINELVSARISAEGFTGALERALANLERWYDVRCELKVAGASAPPDNTVANHLFYIAQEAFNNAAKHASATRLEVSVETDDAFVLRVSDDGNGLPEDFEGRGGLGIQTMRYRAEQIGASLRFSRNETGGTLVTCSLEL